MLRAAVCGAARHAPNIKINTCGWMSLRLPIRPWVAIN